MEVHLAWVYFSGLFRRGINVQQWIWSDILRHFCRQLTDISGSCRQPRTVCEWDRTVSHTSAPEGQYRKFDCTHIKVALACFTFQPCASRNLYKICYLKKKGCLLVHFGSMILLLYIIRTERCIFIGSAIVFEQQ